MDGSQFQSVAVELSNKQRIKDTSKNNKKRRKKRFEITNKNKKEKQKKGEEKLTKRNREREMLQDKTYSNVKYYFQR